MPSVPERYLDVIDVLNRVRSVPDDDLETWWNQFHGMLTGGGRDATAAGYSALKEMQRALESKGDWWRAWLERTTLEDSTEWTVITDGVRVGKPRRVLVDEDDLCGVIGLVDCGFTWAESEARVVARQSARAHLAVHRADVLTTVLVLFEDFGIVGEWTPLRKRYPIAYDRVSVSGFGTLPESIETLADSRLAPQDWRPATEAEMSFGDLLFGPPDDDGLAGKLADLFPEAPTPPPPGVDAQSHRRALVIASALSRHVEEHGAPPDFFGQTGAFLAWAGQRIDLSAASARDALKRAGIVNGEGKSGAAGSGLDARLQKALAYWKTHGPDAENSDAR